jgi:hypothetical protein
MIRLHFRDKNPAVVSALAAEFAGCVDVEVSSGNILRLAGDAIVSPANSFGWMDGGIDLAYLNRFGQWLQPALQGAIAEHFGGELPIGQALIVETHDGSIPFMISAPTMRVPAPVPHSARSDDSAGHPVGSMPRVVYADRPDAPGRRGSADAPRV